MPVSPAASSASNVARVDFIEKRVLVASPGTIPETVFSLPAIRALRPLIRPGNLVVAANEETAPIWRRLESIDKVIHYQSSDSVRRMTRILHEQDKAFDLAIVWEEAPIARALAKVGVSRRLGPSGCHLDKMLTDSINLQSAPGPITHRVQHYLRFVEKLGAHPYQPGYFRPPQRPTPASPDRVALVPGSDFGPSAEWPLERFHEVARELAANHQLAILPSPDRPGPAAKLARLLDLRVTEIAGDGILEFLASCRALVGNDGSLPHLASLVGTPSVVLFGPNHVDWHRPLGKIHRVLHEHVACSGCLLNKCPLDHRCMRELPVEKVLRAFRELPKRTK